MGRVDIVDKVAKDMKGIKVKTAWNQSCTWGIFTLLPVLLFALVSLWQMKVSHDNQIKQIKWELDRTVRELEKSVDLHKAAAKELAEERDMTKKINNPIHYVRVRSFTRWIIKNIGNDTDHLCWDTGFEKRFKLYQRRKKQKERKKKQQKRIYK